MKDKIEILPGCVSLIAVVVLIYTFVSLIKAVL